MGLLYGKFPILGPISLGFFRDSYGNGMGNLPYKVVPLFGVPENPTDRKVEKDQPHLTTQLDVDLLENDWTKHNTSSTSKMMIFRGSNKQTSLTAIKSTKAKFFSGVVQSFRLDILRIVRNQAIKHSMVSTNHNLHE